jgi:hypothetical protein
VARTADVIARHERDVEVTFTADGVADIRDAVGNLFQLSELPESTREFLFSLRDVQREDEHQSPRLAQGERGHGNPADSFV